MGDDDGTVLPSRRRLVWSREFWVGVVVGGVVVGVTVFVLRGGSSNTARVGATAGATTTTVPIRPPHFVRVEVLNGSGLEGAAATKAFELASLGYSIAGVGNANGRSSTIVQCRVGLEREAAELARNVGANTAVKPVRPTTTIDLTKVDCRVTLGS